MRLAVILLLACSAFAQMPMGGITGVSGAAGLTFRTFDFAAESNSTLVSTIATAGTATTTGWNALACSHTPGTLPSSFTDTAGNTYSLLANTLANTGSAPWTECGIAFGITGNASNVVTAHYGTTTNFSSVLVLYWSGGLGVTDASSVSASSTATTWTSGTFSTAVANEIIFAIGAVGANTNTWTAGAIGGTTATIGGQTAASNASASDMAAEYRIVSATQTNITAAITYGASNPGRIIVVTVK